MIVFAQDTSHRLYDAYLDGGLTWTWESQGTPSASVVLASDPSAVYQPTLDRVTVFAQGSDGNLYDLYYNSARWVWESQGAAPPPPACVPTRPAACSTICGTFPDGCGAAVTCSGCCPRTQVYCDGTCKLPDLCSAP
jgi:hypothetical protein